MYNEQAITKRKGWLDNLTLAVCSAFYATYLLSGESGYFSIIVMAFSACIFLLTICRKGLSYSFRWDKYYNHMIVFVAVCFISVLWSVNPARSTQTSILVLKNCICIAAIYQFFIEEKSVERLFKVIMWGGYICSIYTIIFWGSDGIASLVDSGQRLSSEYVNSNTLGMRAAMSIVINSYFIFFKKEIRWWALFVFPSVIIIAVSQSKKALILLFIGLVCTRYFSNLGTAKSKKEYAQNVIKSVFEMICLIVIMLFVLRLSVFNGLMGRADELKNLLLGTGQQSYSDIMRKDMTHLGFELFWKHPLTGVGLDCGRYYTFGTGLYLHNNYAELLADLGLWGIITFYSIHLRFLAVVFNNRNRILNETKMCIILLFLTMILEYGFVAYSALDTFFNYMMFFVEINVINNYGLVNGSLKDKEELV